MKKVLFFTYIFAVLAISSHARADIAFETKAEIQQIAFDPATTALKVAGILPDPCSIPSARLIQSRKSPLVLIVKLAAISGNDMCISVRSDYEKTVQLSALVKAALLEIDPQAVYLVKTSDYDFQVEVPGADLLK